MTRFECQELSVAGGQTAYGVWDTWAEGIEEIHNDRETAERRCEELRCGKSKHALRWWVEAGVRLRSVMWEMRLLWLSAEQREAVGAVHGIAPQAPEEKIMGVLREWCEGMEAMACAAYHLHRTDERKRPAHNMKDSWGKLTEALPDKDLDWIKSEFQAWQKVWNEDRPVAAGWPRSERTLEETFTQHEYSYNEVRYFAHDRKREGGEDGPVKIRLHASEMIAMLVLDQYLLEHLGRYVYRNGETTIAIPGLRIRVPQTDVVHRLNRGARKFEQQSRYILRALLCGGPIEGGLWAQVWDRCTPQDYWRYGRSEKPAGSSLRKN